MTKTEANNKLRRIYRRLKESKPSVELKSLGKCFGQIKVGFEICDGTLDFQHAIELNPHKCGKSFLKTVLHECLHLAYWNAHEKQILKWENEMFGLLTDKQLSNLMKRLYTPP